MSCKHNRWAALQVGRKQLVNVPCLRGYEWDICRCCQALSSAAKYTACVFVRCIGVKDVIWYSQLKDIPLLPACI